MKKILTFISLFIFVAFALKSQSPYILSTLQEPYQALSNPTSINGSSVWSVQKFTIPLPFSVKIGNSTVNQVYTDGTVLYADTMGSNVDILQLFYAYTLDRGYMGSQSKSPLNYEISGNVGSRIFKLEGKSVGFYFEYVNYATMLDSFDYQIWLYEGSNIAEIHFGNAKISHANDYFQAPTPGFCGYMNVNFNTGAGNFGYLAAGDPTNAVMDSLKDGHFPANFDSYPVAGTVYRFTPKTLTALEDFSPTLAVDVYPTLCKDELFLQYHEHEEVNFELLSLSGAKTNVSGKLKHEKQGISLTHLPAGIYLLKIATNSNETTVRIVKL